METRKPDFIFLGFKITTDCDCSHESKRCLLIGGRKAMTNLEIILKNKDITLLMWCIQSKLWFFQQSCMDVRVDRNEGWAPKNWCFPTMVLVKTLESPLDCKGIKSVNSKGNQPWIFIEGLMWELQYFGQLMQKANLLEKTLMLEKKGAGEGGNRGWEGWWHHWFNRYESEQIPGYREGQESLACCSPWVHESGTTEQLNRTTSKETQGQMKVGIFKRHYQFILLVNSAHL